jgi:lysophospholipase L1-like esterase
MPTKRSADSARRNIVCFGDSITQAVNFAEGDRWPTILQCKLDEWKPGIFHVYNRGVGGHTSSEGLDRFEQDVLPLLPAVVLVQFGFNDAYVPEWSRKPRVSLDEFKANLGEIHRAVQAHKGRCVSIVNHTIGRLTGMGGNARSHAENIAPYEAAVRDVARSLKATMIDLPAIMKRRRIGAERIVCDDNLHLSAEGNHLYADFVFESLTPILE